MDRGQVVGILQQMADIVEVESDNPFRSRSFRGAARALDGLTGDFADLVESGSLSELKGIGKSIASVVEELYFTGTSSRYEELLDAVPVGVRELLRVPGLGPKKVRALWKDLEIETVDECVEACESGRVQQISGFGAKSQQKILDGIEYLRSVSNRFLLPEAEACAAVLVAALGELDVVQRIEVAGSYRRRRETVKDIDLLVSTEDPTAVAERFLSVDLVAGVIASGSTKVSVRLANGMAADLRLVSDEEFPFALAYFTGSKEHNTVLRARAKSGGLKLNEYGLFRDGDDASIRCEAEEDIYRELGLPWILPELRENRGEIERAEAGEDVALVQEADVRGVIHLHTTYSDGKRTLREMAEAAKERGYSYIGVTDHSQSAFYAGGLDAEAIARQHEEIDALDGELDGVRIFKGIESDIRADGSLDYDDAVLETFDFVIASLHSSLSQSREEMTARVLRAIENPFTTMVGHLTARLLLRREEVALDIDAVLARAAELGVVLEINANPRRLDLDWRHGPRARELGLLTSINPDAHDIPGIDDIRYGVGIARKACFEAERVVNTFDADGFAEFIARRRT